MHKIERGMRDFFEFIKQNGIEGSTYDWEKFYMD